MGGSTANKPRSVESKSQQAMRYSFQQNQCGADHERRIPQHLAGSCGAQYRWAKIVGVHYSKTQRFRISDKNLQRKLNYEAEIAEQVHAIGALLRVRPKPHQQTRHAHAACLQSKGRDARKLARSGKHDRHQEAKQQRNDAP